MSTQTLEKPALSTNDRAQYIEGLIVQLEALNLIVSVIDMEDIALENRLTDDQTVLYVQNEGPGITKAMAEAGRREVRVSAPPYRDSF